MRGGKDWFKGIRRVSSSSTRFWNVDRGVTYTIPRYRLGKTEIDGIIVKFFLNISPREEAGQKGGEDSVEEKAKKIY